MTHPNPSTALARVVVDELANQGIAFISISPGSRSAALAIAAAQHSDIATTVVIDERSAAFHSLGVALATGVPAAAISTSGSAPAHFFPAVIEADMACVPLVLITADRPAELQGVGANQTIDQTDMFGGKVRASVTIEAPYAGTDMNSAWRHEVSRATAAAANTRRPGPVHLNVRFREPTVPVTDDGRTRGEEYPFATPRLPGENTETLTPPLLPAPELGVHRGLIIAGDGDYDREDLLARASEIGWPVLATAQSGMRGRPVVTTYHHLLHEGVPEDLRPETAVAVGSIGPSARLEKLVAAADRIVRIDSWGRNIDPGRNATHVYHGDVVGLIAVVEGSADPAWSALWLEADRKCRERLDDVLVSDDRMSGGAVALTLNEIGWETLVVASSLPIRDIDAHLVREGSVFANRGASGIDGFVSTSLGIASRRRRTLALAGDLSLLHDANGFLHDADIDLTIVVIDNGGGGLFDDLPQAALAPDYERLFVTDPKRKLEDLARLHGLKFAEATGVPGLRKLADEALGRSGVDLIRVGVDRAYDREVRSRLDG